MNEIAKELKSDWESAQKDKAPLPEQSQEQDQEPVDRQLVRQEFVEMANKQIDIALRFVGDNDRQRLYNEMQHQLYINLANLDEMMPNPESEAAKSFKGPSRAALMHSGVYGPNSAALEFK